jgi:6-pyruvoyltetrahydropterin/6-carboxytetrahydropterin synthase
VSAEIVKAFRFDAAHFLPTAPPATPTAACTATPSRSTWRSPASPIPRPEAGWIVDFAVVAATLGTLRDRLHHHLLNEIDGLALPTLERLAAWIWGELRPSLPGLARITVRRPSEGESCTYRGQG